MTRTGPQADAGERALTAIRQRPDLTIIGVDFDGTLAPIVDDPEQAYVEPAAVQALARLGVLGVKVVVITGRPAQTAVRLGRFTEHAGLAAMVVLGQYGVERWDAATGELSAPPEPESIAAVLEELPDLFTALNLEGVRVEHKGRAIGVHTRAMADPAGAFRALSEPLRSVAERHGLHLEPGKNVLEIRPRGIDKGVALRAIVAELGVRQVIFAGDDLGDLPAFRAVEQLRTEGLVGLLICSASAEEDALADLADLVLDGPTGVAAWLDDLADSLDQ